MSAAKGPQGSSPSSKSQDIMASPATASWYEIIKDRSSRQIEQSMGPPARNSSLSNSSKPFEARIPSNPRPLARQVSQRSVNTLSVYPASSLKRSSTTTSVRRGPAEDSSAPALPDNWPRKQYDVPFRRISKNEKRTKTALDRQGSLQDSRWKIKTTTNGSEIDRDIYSNYRPSKMNTPKGRRTAQPGSIVPSTSITIPRSNPRKTPNQMAKLSLRLPVELSSLPISPMPRQGPAEEISSDSASLSSPSLELVGPPSSDYTPATLTDRLSSLVPAPLNLTSIPKHQRSQAAPRPDSTTLGSSNLASPNLPSSSPTQLRQPSTTRITNIPTSLITHLLTTHPLPSHPTSLTHFPLSPFPNFPLPPL